MRFRISTVGPFVLALGGLGFFSVLPDTRTGALGMSRFLETRVEGGSFPKSLRSPDGTHRTIAAPPRRIVSLVLGADEILTAIVEPERLVAVSRFADSPELSTCADRVPPGAARIRGLDPESIIALQPDMVFVAGYTLESAVRILVGTGTAVVRFGEHRSFEDVARNVRVAAAAVGAESRAEALLRGMRARLDRVDARVRGRPTPRVLYYSPVGYTSGMGTLIDDKITRAGGRNVVSEAGLSGPRHLSVDLLVALDPEVIVVPRWAPGDAAEREIQNSSIWRRTSAVRSHRVFGIDAKWLTSVSPDGVRGVEELARILHPEVFGS
jgi:iron complex transport system substrate-binding protein